MTTTFCLIQILLTTSTYDLVLGLPVGHLRTVRSVERRSGPQRRSPSHMDNFPFMDDSGTHGDDGGQGQSQEGWERDGARKEGKEKME